MPDVCLSPPSPPAGPVPIPYPNTAMSSDTDGGTTSVKIQNKPVMMKNSSSYKSSKGDEAATNSFGAGVVSHKISGPAKFAAYSFDVKFEGANVCRLGDLTTHNHANTTNGATIASLGKPGVPLDTPLSCAQLQIKNEEAQDEAHPRRKPPKLHKGETIVASQFTTPTKSGNKTFLFKSQSTLTDTTKNKKGWARGNFKKGAKKMEATQINCKDANYKPSRSRNQGPMCHCESRISETIFKALNKGGSKPAGTLVLRIQWKKKDGKISTNPCDQCEKMLCAAKRCGISVKICGNGKDGKPSARPKELKC